jgi:putative peptidoglycan lipid II flippase
MSSESASAGVRTMTEPTGAATPRFDVPFVRHVISTFGITILQQIFGLVRQALIAAFFGLSRQFDGYLLIYALATMAIFNLSGVFDSVAVARLVQVRERDGEAAFWRSSNRLLLQSVAGSLLSAIGLYVLLIVLLPIVAAGFSATERALLIHLVVYFLPWVAIILPYYAVSAHLKAIWRFHWVFGAELAVILMSTVVLWLWHYSIECLPVAYGVGYMCALTALLMRRGFRRAPEATAVPGLLKSMANQSLANQIGSAAGLVERYFQSFLAVGGISALGYAGLIVNNLSSLITFREIYVVPLASELGREQKLQRMMKGCILISVPCAGFIIAFAGPIISLLFQRGQFTPPAAALTAGVLRIMVLSLAISTLLAPMVRLFQILDRISYSHVIYLVSLIGTGTFQYVFVFLLAWDVRGVASAQVATSALVTVVVALLVRRCGVEIRWSGVIRTLLFAILVTAFAVVLSTISTSAMPSLFALIAGGAIYGAVVGAAYFSIRRRWSFIISGA